MTHIALDSRVFAEDCCQPPCPCLPLGLGSLNAAARAACSVPFKYGDRLLFYTDGISEARDKQGTFYPLERTGAFLGSPDLGLALDRLSEDVLRHVGHALLDDAAILLIGRGRPLSPWPGGVTASQDLEPGVQLVGHRLGQVAEGAGEPGPTARTQRARSLWRMSFMLPTIWRAGHPCVGLEAELRSRVQPWSYAAPRRRDLGATGTAVKVSWM